MKVGFIFAENVRWWAFLSPVFMKISKVDFSHCGVVISNDNYALIYHSEWPYGYKTTLEKWLKTYKIKHQFLFEVDSHTVVQMLIWLRVNVRKPYSIMQLIYIFIYKTFPYSRFYLHKKILNGDSKDICTEFLASFIEKFFNVNFTKSDDLIDLNDVFNMVKKLNGVEKCQSLE